MKVLKSWGTEGQVVLSLASDDPEDFDLDEPVFITFDGLPVPFFIESIEPKGNRFIVKFEDIDSLKAAEDLVGRPISLSETEEEEDEESIVGMTVLNAADGSVVGTVTGIEDYAGNTCITVNHKGKEVTLPFHEDLVEAADEESLTLRIAEGLLEL